MSQTGNVSQLDNPTDSKPKVRSGADSKTRTVNLLCYERHQQQESGLRSKFWTTIYSTERSK